MDQCPVGTIRRCLSRMWIALVVSAALDAGASVSLDREYDNSSCGEHGCVQLKDDANRSRSVSSRDRNLKVAEGVPTHYNGDSRESTSDQAPNEVASPNLSVAHCKRLKCTSYSPN